jgi:hypothetical protein
MREALVVKRETEAAAAERHVAQDVDAGEGERRRALTDLKEMEAALAAAQDQLAKVCGVSRRGLEGVYRGSRGGLEGV